MHCIRGDGGHVSSVASTGLASNLLIGGRTYFSQFGLPVPLVETSVSQIKASTAAGKLLKQTKLIIWDEVTMAPNIALNAVDHCLRELKGNDKPFGGTVVLLGGDFRQTLPVLKHAHRVSVVQSTIKFSPLWCKFKHHKLIVNKRAQEDPAFCDWLIKLGDGELATYENSDLIEIPQDMGYG
jgi:ATP-dependent DNA helicase PIF1